MYENQIGLKFIDALGFKATQVENAYTTIPNNETNKAVIRVEEGPAKGESTSIAFFRVMELLTFILALPIMRIKL
ncbi:MAG: hypothetical protein ABR515_02955 [Nitrososphaeraceae archaeon]